MSLVDYVIFGAYMLGVVGVGYYHFRKNRDAEDYYVGGRNVASWHVGLSIVATDVGGGFSIGLGGVGFLMGLAGSWLLFTGLVGAWYLAGLFEYPVMAFTGVFLGMCARVVFPDAESEMAMPMLIRNVLPAGVVGIVLAAYFSAIMSTADSCLMASSGNFVNDIIEPLLPRKLSDRGSMRLSMLATLVIGVTAVVIAASFKSVLDAILYAYAFMVGGLFVPTVGAYFWRRGSAFGALLGMLGGGELTLIMLVLKLPPEARWGLDPSLYGIVCSLVLYVLGSLAVPDRPSEKEGSDE